LVENKQNSLEQYCQQHWLMWKPALKAGSFGQAFVVWPQHWTFQHWTFQHWPIGSMLTSTGNVDSIGLILLNQHWNSLSTSNQYVNVKCLLLRSNDNVEIQSWGSKSLSTWTFCNKMNKSCLKLFFTGQRDQGQADTNLLSYYVKTKQIWPNQIRPGNAADKSVSSLSLC
jgi:hypothetical protein